MRRDMSDPAPMDRHFPRPSELAPLMRFKRPNFDGRSRRLNAALTIADLRAIAKRRTPKGAFDYTDGAAEQETLAAARAAGISRHRVSSRDLA